MYDLNVVYRLTISLWSMILTGNNIAMCLYNNKLYVVQGFNDWISVVELVIGKWNKWDYFVSNKRLNSLWL